MHDGFAASQHARNHLRHEERSPSIDRDRVVEAFRRDVHEVFEHHDASVVDEEVDSPARPFHRLQVSSGRQNRKKGNKHCK